jgi:hypothetical protein
MLSIKKIPQARGYCQQPANCELLPSLSALQALSVLLGLIYGRGLTSFIAHQPTTMAVWVSVVIKNVRALVPGYYLLGCTGTGGKMPTKYEPLDLYFRALSQNVREVTPSFPEIERILGAPLPKSSTQHRAWWANQQVSKSRPQVHAWLSAGFLVDTVNQRPSIGSVRFKRK